MYEVGAYVVKTGSGLCQIADILHPDLEWADADRLYYLLIPVSNKTSRLYLPIDKGESNLRNCLTKSEAQNVIRSVPDIDAVNVSNEKLREQAYKDALRSMRPEDLVSVIKNIYIRRIKRNAQGKKNTAMDDRFYKMAEDMLYVELAFALGTEKSEISKAVTKKIQDNEVLA